MAKAIRLSVIGAGSAQFSLGLVRDLCLSESLRGSTVSFMDVDEGRLHMVCELAHRYAAELGSDLRFEKTQDREASLSGADFVINTALAGGHRREEDERALMTRQGYYRGLHPSEGSYYQYDLMLSVARDIERLCPNAWLIQSSNPVFDGCTLMTRETDVKVVGLCHGPFGGIREIAKVLKLNYDDITFEAPGFNHCVWMTHFRYQGQDAYPLLDAWIDQQSEAYWHTWQPKFHESQLSPAAVHMYKFYGLMPLGDASRAIWPEAWWYHQNFENKQRWFGPLGGFDSDEGWALYLEQLEQGLKAMREAAADPKARLTDLFPPQKSGEQIVPIIDALANDRRGYFIVNVPNNGALQGVPDNVVVEVPAVVDGKGIRPTMVGNLPQPIMLGAIYPQWLAMERRLVAFMTRDPRFIMQLLLAEQRTRSWDHAEETLNVMMAMPGNEAMAAHFGKTPQPTR